MSIAAEAPREAPHGADPYRAVADLFGGVPVLGQAVASPFDVHDLIETGLPRRSLAMMRQRLGPDWTDQAFARILGITSRTLQRGRDKPRLDVEQGNRAWKFAELLTLAADVLGSQAAAEDWMRRPARALEGRVPLDLLDTAAGTELVEQVLVQMEYGVFV